MGVARVFRKPSLQQEDRLPISTYEQAINRLVFIRCNETYSDDYYEGCVHMVADTYWRSDKRVRADVIKAARVIGG